MFRVGVKACCLLPPWPPLTCVSLEACQLLLCCPTCLCPLALCRSLART